jgi:hypothetical protein
MRAPNHSCQQLIIRVCIFQVFSEAEIEQIVQNDGDLIAEMLQRHSPAHLADVERKALLRPGVQFAHWVRAVEEGKLSPDELANFEPPEVLCISHSDNLNFNHSNGLAAIFCSTLARPRLRRLPRKL